MTDWGEVERRLAEIERDWSWLARRIGISKQRLSNYKRGLHAPPERVRRDVEVVLGLTRVEQAA